MPSKVIDPKEATDKLVRAFPDLDRDDVYRKLTSGREFVWLKRKMTPRQAAHRAASRHSGRLV